jgi:D-serine deaminase-like pyridoxal phosphate-dependent protein
MARDRIQVHERTYEELERVFADVDAPFAFVDLDAMWSNAREMLGRAAGTPIRVASKSLRCRSLLASVLDEPGFRGLMTFTLPESLWLHEHGFDDLLLAYPTAHRGALAELGRLESERSPILMVDSVAHLDLIESAVGRSGGPVRVCIDLDVSWWPLGGRLKIGVKRSPLRTPEDARELAREIVKRPRLELAGLMGYEAHIAGLGDSPLGEDIAAPRATPAARVKRVQAPLIRQIKRLSASEIAERRAAVVAAVSEVAPLPLVNGGGTGSIHTTSREDVITEVTAGSGLYAPTLFDRYSSFSLTPAAMFAMPVVRKPSGSTATLLGGGYHASGPAGRDRLPTPHLPRGLRVDPLEGAGEVQTPVLGSAAASLQIGANVYLRHAKAGELCERFNTLYLVRGGEIADEVPTYRGEGRCEL